MNGGYLTVSLEHHHQRAGFDCGVDALNRYLSERAGQDLRNNVAVVYVHCAPTTSTVIGYYTLSATTIELNDLPVEMIRRLPRYPLLPAALIGRLAVDCSQHGQGLGERLLLDALCRCAAISTQLGTVAVVVDAKDDSAGQFYERYGFLRFLQQPQRLYLPMKTIVKLFPTP